MISAIFNDELTTIESAIAQYQALIEAKRLEADKLNQAQTVTDSALQRLQDALATVANVAPDAIDKLKTAVLGLFGNDNDTDGGNDPETPPTPPTDGEKPNFDNFVTEVRTAIAVEPAPLPEQPETAPQAEPVKDSFVELKMLSDDVGYLINRRGELLAGYCGFNNRTKAQSKGKELAELLNMGYEVRDAASGKKRLSHKYELRLLDISLIQLQKLADEMKPRLQPAFDRAQEPKTVSSEGLPEFALINDTSDQFGQTRFVYGVEGDRTLYGKIYPSVAGDTYLHSGQQSNDYTTYATEEDAARALIKSYLVKKQLHENQNKAMASRFLKN